MADAPSPGSLFAELRRRHVFKVGAAYLVAAWLAVQVASIAFPAFDAPPWVLRVFILLCVLGFPAALVLAWAFESTPDGVRLDPSTGGNRRMAAITAVLVVLGLGWYVLGAPALRQDGAASRNVAASASSDDAGAVAGTAGAAAAAENGKPAPAADVKSIAVLPFANLSDDKANEYFVAGLQDLILTKLAEIGELRVASRTSTEKYAEHRAGVREMAAELGVAFILEGSVQKAGDQVLVNVQLIDGRTDGHLWAQAYRRTLDDIFGVEGEVAKLVAEALHLELSVAEQSALAAVTTHDREAYDRYLRSRYYLNAANRSLDAADLDRSIELAKEAVAIDPAFVDGWALLSLAYTKRAGPDAITQAEAAARQVLALDPDNADGHLHLGFALGSRGLADEAVDEARAAARLRPDKMKIQLGLAITLAGAGRFEEAKAPLEAAAILAPENLFVRNWHGGVLIVLREYTAGRDLVASSFARDPADLFAVGQLLDALLYGFGDVDGARRALQRVPFAPAENGTLAVMAADVETWGRDFAAARKHLDAIPDGTPLPGDLPRSAFLAPVLEAAGDAAGARAAWADARARLQAALVAKPDDALLQRTLARALSGLGDHAAARTAAERATTLAEHALTAPLSRRVLAEVQMRAGRPDDAVATLQALLAEPAGAIVSPASLRLHPMWDPLRGNPAFEALLAQYPPGNPVPQESR